MTTIETVMGGRARWLRPLCGLVLLAVGPIDASAMESAQHPSSQPSATLTPADPGADMPVPKQHHRISVRTTRAPGIEAPLRIELKARVPAELSAVLAFYRAELAGRGWEEKPEETMVAVGRAQLAFVSPKGPASLKLGRDKDETTVDLVQRNTEVASKANFLPVAGQARLIFGFLAPDVASLVIDDQTIKIAGGVDHPQTLDLPPGTYSYGLSVAGRLVHTSTITVSAGEAWSLRLDDEDRKAEQIY